MPFAFASSLIPPYSFHKSNNSKLYLPFVVVVMLLAEFSTYKSIVIKIFAETYGKSRRNYLFL